MLHGDSDADSDMQISNDEAAPMDVDEEQQQQSEEEEEQVGVDVLPDAGSDSDADATDGAEGENEVEEPEEYELEDEDDEIQESRSPSVAAAPAAKSPLKIKFKVRPGAVTRGRRTRATAIQVESEDSEESESEEEMPQNVRLTKRQAALAKARKGIVASEETSVDEEDPNPAPSTSKRKRGGARAALDPSEVALRKEESARKRRNVSEKKLQNEKAETINRLLKKQSRPRNKRTTALSGPGSTATPVEVPTPVSETGAFDVNVIAEDAGTGIQVQGQVPEDGGGSEMAMPTPTMYRWVSRSTSSAEGAQAVMSITFSVPPSVVAVDSERKSNMEVSEAVKGKPPAEAVCGVAGCGQARRYRLVGGEWGVGACGMGHLKVLEGR